ncbi:MAG: histidine kinase [Gemmatimonadota bacterium]
MSEATPPQYATLDDDASLTSREIAFICGFWLLYALLNFANRLFDMMSRGRDMVIQVDWITVPMIDAVCWALLTIPLFSLAARFSGDRLTPARRVALFGILGVAVVVLLGIIGTMSRSAFSTPQGGGPAGGPRGRRGGPPPFWFGMINALVIYLGVLAAGFARAYSLQYRARREQATILERQLAEARLDALRRQLDPHFLFNTLNAVASLVERDPRGVRKMISRLGALLRFSLEGADAAEIPLRKELELLQQYLEIMQVRFQGRLDVVTNADSRTLDALVPTLVLQPLVENAIKHGIEPQRDGGRITIETRLDGGRVTLSVRDDGHGIPASVTSVASTGVGLRNTRARLSQLYGEHQSFELAASASGGTVATVTIPFHTTSDA